MQLSLDKAVADLDSNHLLLELIKITDIKIDLMEYIIEKLEALPLSEQARFAATSSAFDRIDWLNMEFLSCYQKLLAAEGIKEIHEIRLERKEVLKDLKHLVEYAFELENGLEKILSKL